MRVGDLVRSTTPGNTETWIGMIVGLNEGDFVVFWNNKFPDELEYASQLEVISASS